MQKIWGVVANTPSGFLNDAANYSNSSNGATGTSQSGNSYTAAASPTGGFGTGTAQDLSDLFVSGTIPANLPGLNLSASGYAYNRHTGTYAQTVTVTNTLVTAITNPVYLVLGNLSSNTSLLNSTGTSVHNSPGSPYILVSSTGLGSGSSSKVSLQYSAPTSGTITSTMSAITTSGQP